MGKTAERVARLSPQEQRTLLTEMLHEKANEPRLAPASFAQERLWFLDQLEPGNPSYNMPAAVRLCGRLDLAALSQSLDEIVRRHETLRTTFATTDGRPVQVIAPVVVSPLAVIDLQSCPEARREAETWRLITAEARRPFDLAQGPLFRASLLRLDDEQHVLLLNVSHIVSDGWSQGVLLRELAALYEAFSNTRPLPLSELPLQYADFARWQRRWLQGEVLDAQLSYWKEQLGDAPTALELPTDRPRPAVQTFHGARQSRVWSRSSSRALKALSQREGVTLFVTLLAAFKVLLYRYTGQSDLVVGSPVAGRNRTELEGLIGFFVNTLVLRTDLSGDPTFRELLRRLRETVTDAYAHQDLPFEKLVEELQLERDLSRNPLCQVMFAFQNAPMPALELPGLALAPLETDSGAARFDLTLSVWDTSQGLRGVWEYNTDLFDAHTIERMQGHFQALLERIVANEKASEQHLSNLSPLTGAERRQLLVEWNDTSTAYAEDKCIHELFEAQAKRTPDAIAIVFNDECLSYGKLDRQANQLAYHLQWLRVGPEVLVGICVERSLEMLVGLLGILKAGGAYIPLDPVYPRERLAFMLEDTQAPVLLTQHHLLEKLSAHQAQVVCLDSDWTMIASRPQTTPPCATAADNLAYTIYTSGSTGRPKGVQILHRAAVNFLGTMRQRPGLTMQDAILSVATLSFDIALLELFLPLTMGACVVLVNRAVAADGVQLIERLTTSRATVMQATPATWRLLLAADWQGDSSLRVLCGGEALPPALAHQLLACADSVWNLYGPTETTVWSIVHELTTSDALVPIGRPIANTEICLLDSHLQPVPVGVSGELYVGGAGLARGYLHRPGLSAERFVPNPFPASSFPSPGRGERGGARLYKTGDLARYRPDGNIEFLGRVDYQVKLRGFRIELGEIEAVLVQHPAVREAVALVREDMPQQKRLVAYLVTREKSAPTAGGLRRFLQERLPDYMLPSIFVTLDALPLTPNGKVNRRALPAPERDRPELEGTFKAPSTPVEEMLARIWSQVLGIERVGVHDNFFELGGHSLLATQILSRVRDAFQVDLPLRTLFAALTVADLAERVEAACWTEQDLPALLAQPVSQDGGLPLSFAQQRLWFLDQLAPGTPFYNIPAAIRLIGPLNVAALEQSLDEVVGRQASLRTTFAPVDGRPIQIVSSTLSVMLPVIDLQELSIAEREAQVQRLATEEAQRPFVLARGPLLRVTLLRLGKKEHVLFLTMHHIISDGWSIGVLIRELAMLYQAFDANEPLSFPKLPIQYTQFAAWQRNWLQGEVLETQLSYWKAQLGHEPPVLALVTDRPRPPIQTFRGACQSFALSKPLSEALKTLSRQEGVTLFMTLLAAFQTLLTRYTGQTDIAVGSPIANRNRSEIEGLVGFFVNILVLRTDLSGNPTFRDLAGRVREVTLGAYAHQDVPFEMLVETLQPERDLRRSPLFQVMFVLQNAPLEPVALPGLTLIPLEVESGTAKFDLTLALVETKQGLRGTLEYNTDLFDAGTMERLVGHLQTLLRGIVADPEQRISNLPLLSETQRHQLLVEWNATEADFPQDQCIHDLFETQAAQTPDAVAVVFQDQHLSYRELNRRANQLAHYLRRLGVGSEMLVGLCVERSLEMVLGLLGILKAGGAYVPLDPAYPKERLAFILQDTQAPLLLTQHSLASRLPSPLLLLDADWPAIAEESDTNPVNYVTADSLAYAIYTSGSTGWPKGVLLSHRGLCNVSEAQLRTFRPQPTERVLQFASLSFDASTFEIFLALLQGATLCLGTRASLSPGPPLVRLLQDLAVTIATLTPSTLALLPVEELATLQTVNVAGEACPAELLARWVEGRRFFNLYGPTEGTIWTTAAACTTTDEKPPIGVPIANTKVYILDAHLRPVPVGVPGELCISSIGLARGYLNRPALTAERFIPNPFIPLLCGHPPYEEGQRGGGRLYRTGDLARYLPDGSIEFLGRMDYQVKMRGFRIELGEIEAVLNEHPQVQESVAMVCKDRSGDKRLVGYLVTVKEPAPTAPELKNFLRDRLPDYMLPAAFVKLDALPLMPNGKLDRRALPAPEHGRPELEQAFVAPRTPLEETLSGIWAQILGLERVGVHDNFFELGGHSLLATQVMSCIHDVCRVEVPLRTLFEHPTVAGLAAGIAQHQVKQRDDQMSIVPTTDEAYTEQLLGRLDTLADEEMDVLLSKMLAGEEEWT